ncbi:MAG: RNA-binding protein [Candidatus Melainabacteria bacterium]|nr:RNA-binding protein [Candidatus Melainabacteria bacterium]
MNNKLYIGNLEYSVQSDELKAAFSKWEISDCIIIEGKGFGFVTFADADSANQAKEEMNNQELRGRQMKIDFAQERASSGGSRGGRRNDFKKRY